MESLDSDQEDGMIVVNIKNFSHFWTIGRRALSILIISLVDAIVLPVKLTRFGRCHEKWRGEFT